MKERVDEGSFRRVYHDISERIVTLIDKGARRRTVLTVVEAANSGEKPDEETLHHFIHIPGEAVKDILTGHKREER